MPLVTIRPARPADAPTIVRLIKALAAYENEPASAVRITEADVLAHGFGERRYFEAVIAELDDEPVGFALYFHNYSTWEGRPGIYVEDLFVEPGARGHGVGRRLMAHIARVALERGCRRIDLWVLHWNTTREFYHRLGLRHMDEWLPYRMAAPEIARLAGEASGEDGEGVDQ